MVLSLWMATHAASAAGSPRLFHCDQLDVVRPIYQQSVDMRVDGNDRPTHVRLNRLVWASPEVESVSPRYLPGYQQGYWLNNYGLETWYMGQTATGRYALLTPTGGLGGQFDIQVHQYFAAGGWWQTNFHCVIQ